MSAPANLSATTAQFGSEDSGPASAPLNGAANMDADGDNRSRNAKAQRRHREKRKAHLKQLEESVQLLTAQLEESRRMGQAGYGGQRMGGPMSPQPKDYNQVQAENAYLREENADLRRQLYAYKVNYGHMAPQPGEPGPSGSHKDWEAKPEGFGGVSYGGQGGVASPRGEAGHGGNPGPQGGNGNGNGGRGGNGNGAGNGGYGAPSASPYLPSPSSSVFPSDPRSQPVPPHSASVDRYPQSAPVRYDSHSYPSQPHHSPTSASSSGPALPPPPHHMPRSSLGYGSVDVYGRSQGDMYNPEAGPPPLTNSYPGSFPQQQQTDGWRQ